MIDANDLRAERQIPPVGEIRRMKKEGFLCQWDRLNEKWWFVADDCFAKWCREAPQAEGETVQ